LQQLLFSLRFTRAHTRSRRYQDLKKINFRRIKLQTARLNNSFVNLHPSQMCY
jgi:hypothetical protein